MPRHRIGAILLLAVVAAILCLRTPEWPTVLNRPGREILNSTLGFQHIFAINLPSRTDRRDALVLAAALSGLDITWVNGVSGEDVDDRVLPGDPSISRELSLGKRGSWRAHMNVLQRIVDENITSALILEDDADWDVRLKSQMQVFAQAARAFTLPSWNGRSVAEQFRDPPGQELPLNQLPQRTRRPRLTPYGDDWDVLWLGHCGTGFPEPTRGAPTSSFRVTIRNDDTVPPPQHLRPHPFALQDALSETYPPHTRVVHAVSRTVCTQAYAVSQQGARKLLWQFGLQTLTTGWDLMLRDWCDGLYDSSDTDADADAGPEVSDDDRPRPPLCVTAQPPLFSHHYGRGAASDITAPGGGFVNKEKEMTPYVRRSVRLNMERLVNGQEAVEQWKCEGESSSA
ncbi:glycosyltransferase family 25 protein [Thermothelomyces heterothallicus CBS 202.75]|uniref:glycosyltransferase family 25 protein n=1 Tax=Thermothelomyces heterothallicus CBS 202.75 TaxID=1149848 RepID=UPI00374254EE